VKTVTESKIISLQVKLVEY